MVHKIKYTALVRKTHFLLCRMHVEIDPARVHFKKNKKSRMCFFRGQSLISFVNSICKGLVLDRPLVHKDKLHVLIISHMRQATRKDAYAHPTISGIRCPALYQPIHEFFAVKL